MCGFEVRRTQILEFRGLKYCILPKPVKPPLYLCGKKEVNMFAVLVFIALVVNVLGSITGKGDRWGE